MKMMNIVIVTYNWPPRNAIGTHRPYAWAKYWNELGAKITVLTAKKCFYDEPLDLELPKLPGVEVIEVSYRQLDVHAKRGGSYKQIINLLKKGKSFLARHVGMAVDVRGAWASAANNVIDGLANRADVVVSTFGPASAHQIAYKMKKKNPELRWIADYRDLWSQRHASDLPVWKKRKESRKEKQLLASADCVTTVSEELADDLKKICNSPVKVIMNGFDIDEPTLKKNLAQHKVKRRNGRMTVVYTGMVYPKLQDPTPLLNAMSNLSQSGKITPDNFSLEFYGSRTQSAESIVKACGMSDFVVFNGHVPRERALKAQSDADFVLLLESSMPEAKGVLTGKLFEYIASGSPILSLGSTKDSAISRVLDETGCGVCLQDNVEAIVHVLIDALDRKTPDWYRPKFGNILNYSRKKQSVDMFEKILLN